MSLTCASYSSVGFFDEVGFFEPGTEEYVQGREEQEHHHEGGHGAAAGAEGVHAEDEEGTG